MKYTTLGRPGLRVSVAGLGCGGHSRLGLNTGRDEANAVAVVRRALDVGITLFDTAEAYGTEDAVGKGLQGRRDEVVVCTKALVHREGHPTTADELTQALEASLRRLRTDRVDVYFLHGVVWEQYEHAIGVLRPAMERLREQGKIRFAAISEAFTPDPGHRMLQRAVPADDWDVVMVGFNLLNHSARERVFPHTRERGIGTLNMFAVRRALSRPDVLHELVQQLRSEGHARELDPTDPLGFLVTEGTAHSVVEAAYRFCRHEPGIDVVLTGTGDPTHLEENVRSILAPPLPERAITALHTAFGAVDHISGN